MAELDIKKIKFGDKTYKIVDSEAVHKTDKASTTAFGVVMVGTGLEINTETGALDVTSAGKVDWTGVENRPFNSVNGEDFTITGATDSDKVLNIDSTKWATAEALKDGLAKKLDSDDFNATNIVSKLGTTPVNRATSDASGNDIASTYETKTNVSTELAKKLDKTTHETFVQTVVDTYETKSDASSKQKTLQDAIDLKVAKSDFNTFVNTTAPATYLGINDVASATKLGAIKIGYAEADRKFAVKLDSSNKAYVEVPEYELPNASATTLGGIKIGSGLAISEEGVASVDVDNIDVKWTKVSGKPFESVSSDDFVVSSNSLNINSANWLQVTTAQNTYETKSDATSKKEALETEIAKKVAQSDFDAYVNTTAPGKYVAIEGFKTSYLDANSVAYKSDFDSYYTKTETDSKITSEIKSQVLDKKGANGGFAELDENGTVPSSQLPSYVDDVLEYETLSKFPENGESGKIYVALDTNLTYRWSGTQYVEISASLALGETSSTAYAGDKGKANADNISALTTRVTAIEGKGGNYVLKTTTVNGHALSSNVTVTKSDVELGNVANTGDSATPVANGTTKFTTGGAFTLKSDLESAIAKKQDTLTQGTGITIASNTIAVNLTNNSDEFISVAGNAITSKIEEGTAPSLSMSVDSDGVLEISFTAGSTPLTKKSN